MPTPQGMGGDPPQEGEDERQTPMIPKDPSPSPPTTPSQPHPPRVRLRTPDWTVPPKVLLVDDDVVCRRLSSKFLQIFGCFIDVAVDGVGAVNKMNLEKYDLVFMDIVMPKLDGVSATSLIRQFDHLTPIISMTSNSKPNEVVRYYSSGMNDILPKPFTKDDLLQKLEKHLIHLRAAQEQFRRLSRSPSGEITPLIGNADQLPGFHSTALGGPSELQSEGNTRLGKRSQEYTTTAAHILKRRK
ncbi:CheY-like superfamily [Cytidiella melzeri]|nr:CheY-like superfamily [Cytidiella melzeri]